MEAQSTCIAKFLHTFFGGSFETEWFPMVWWRKS